MEFQKCIKMYIEMQHLLQITQLGNENLRVDVCNSLVSRKAQQHMKFKVFKKHCL
jgi:hypothetical protein